MQLTLAHIGSRKRDASAKSGYESLTQLYVDRIQPYMPIKGEIFATESAFFVWLDRQRGRQPALPVLLDSRGKALATTEFAAWLAARRDQGAQHLVFAIGPADGWTDASRARATLLLSFGPITMPHELARLVLAEQLYRACTILAGHPYHGGH